MKKIYKRIFISVICVIISISGFFIYKSYEKYKNYKEDAVYLLNFLEDNYPYFQVKRKVFNYDFLSHKDEFIKKISKSKNDNEFFKNVNQTMFCLQNGHSYIYRGGLPSYAPKEQLKKYDYWMNIQNQSIYLPDIKLKYVQGKYIVIKSKNKDIPIDSFITKINGKNINDYINSNKQTFLLFRDTKRNINYSIFDEYWKYDNSKDMVEVLCNGTKKEAQINYNKFNDDLNTWYYSNPQRSGENITADKINSKLAYLRIKSFHFKNPKEDKKKISDLFNSLNKYDNLIIDVRGNFGGHLENSYFLSSFLTDKYPKYYQCMRNTKFMNDSKIQSSNYAARVTFLNKESVLKNNYNLDGFNVKDVKFNYQFLTSKKFKGSVYVLVDGQVYSATENFIDKIKTLKNVTIVGTTTGGDGTGLISSPISLPKSNLMIQIPVALTINEDGTVDEEVCISPHIYVEQSIQDYSNYLKTNLKDISRSKYDTVYNKTLDLIKNK
ncbi:S41 family peptidase [Clostridium massiliodielmoense]|uniref:S41 family peptidase n=1 Tax=Clostridium massiliodielmoense TaxID=1776385 RepID=UPI000A51F266|nr:S41 family peptidase [Clostridium massiliodielmoense]